MTYQAIQLAYSDGQANACKRIRARLAAYTRAYDKSMTELRDTSYATDICTIAATASRQLAVIQCLETLLLEIAGEA